MTKNFAIKIGLLIAFACLPASAVDWSNCKINSIKLINEKSICLKVFSITSNSGNTFFYNVDPFWPAHSTSELKATLALILTAISTGKNINLNWDYKGTDYTFLSINTIEIIN